MNKYVVAFRPRGSSSPCKLRLMIGKTAIEVKRRLVAEIGAEYSIWYPVKYRPEMDSLLFMERDDDVSSNQV